MDTFTLLLISWIACFSGGYIANELNTLKDTSVIAIEQAVYTTNVACTVATNKDCTKSLTAIYLPKE